MTTSVTRVRLEGSDGKRELHRLQVYIANPAKVLKDDYRFNEVDFQLSTDFTYDITRQLTGNTQVKLVSGYRCTVEDFANRVMQLRDLYLHYRHLKPDSGPIAYHIVLSWPHGALVSDEEVYRIGCLLLQALGDYPGIIAAHIDPVWDEKHSCWTGEQKHSHVVVSAYPDSFDAIPHKLQLGRGNIKIRELADKLAIDYQQEILVDPDTARAHSYPIAKNQESWLRQMREAVQKAAEEASDMDAYTQLLAVHGISIYQEEERLIYQLDEHYASERSLGRDFTRQGLHDRWTRELADKSIECPVDTLEAQSEELFVDIPLGGTLQKNRSVYQFALHNGATNYSEDVLRKYFPIHRHYTVRDKAKKVSCNVTGQQILDYLGVGVTDNGVAPGVDRVVEMKRLAWASERVRRQIERRCESQLWAQDREWARVLRWQDVGSPRRNYCGEHEVVYYNRNSDGTKKTLSEQILLMLCYYCIPNFSIEDYCEHATVEPAKKLADCEFMFGPTNLEIQAIMYSIQIAREEGVTGYFELYAASREAERRYEEVADQLAAVNENLLRDQDLYDTLMRCRRARNQLRKIQGTEGEDLNEETRDAIISEYEEAVSKAKSHIGGHWADWNSIINQYNYLRDIKVALQQAVYAEYERKERLRLVAQQQRISEYQISLRVQRKEQLRALPKPSINLIIESASRECKKGSLQRKGREETLEIKRR